MALFSRYSGYIISLRFSNHYKATEFSILNGTISTVGRVGCVAAGKALASSEENQMGIRENALLREGAAEYSLDKFDGVVKP